MSLFVATLFLALLVQPVMAQDGGMNKMKKKNEKSIYVTEKGTEYKLMGWETNTVYDPFTYTWYEYQEPVYSEVQTKRIYPVPISEFDRPPLFDKSCMDAKDKLACTNDKIQAYVADQDFEYPQAAKDNLQAGLEYVSFVLDKDGKIKNISVLSKDKPCKGCADKAADIVASMQGMWYPAIKDGEKVATKLTVPIRFKLLPY